MTNQDFEQFWQAITVIEAQEMLIGIKVADFPHYKKPQREKLSRELHKQAYPREYENRKSITAKELGALING